ncbi:MAG TPA: c-type cytochrome [Pseudogracilibacillus sp.]|nr:c-type cytochrome [Pseudogracilibacillus sp.]
MRKWEGMLLIVFLVLILVSCQAANDNEAEGNDGGTSGEPDITPTSELDPDDPMTEAIQYGEEIFNETNTVMSDYVGNELSCQSCHADGGLSKSSSLVGVTADYPQYRPREGIVFTLEDRINGCMIRSMNGEMIPNDSEEMRAMIAYFTHLSEGVEVGQERPWVTVNSMDEVPEPDLVSGEELYEKKNCLSCHGDDGSGTGANSGPALWGDNSFNDGAGMGRLTKMAGYIQNNMPIGEEYELSDQEAADLAAYLLSKDRPEWKGHDDDFPHGKRPSDIITKDRREAIQKGEFDWTEIDNVIPGEKQ